MKLSRHLIRRMAPLLALPLVAAGCWIIQAAPVAAAPKARPPAPPVKSIDDCERYNEPLAYNACLASFGPARAGGGAMVTPEVASDGEKAGRDGGKAERRYSRRDRRHGRSYRAHPSGGRVSASFSVPTAIINPGRGR